MIISMIAAVAENRVIGKDNDLVWRLPKDMRYFMDTTKGHHIISGRKNYESIPAKLRPLKDRVNIIVTRDKSFSAEGALVVHSIQEALQLAENTDQQEVFIIGGGEIYLQALDMAGRLYLTEVKSSFEGDTHFPLIKKEQWNEVYRMKNPIDEKHAYEYDFVILERK